MCIFVRLQSHSIQRVSLFLLLAGLREVVGLRLLGLLGADSPEPGDGTGLPDGVEGLELLEVVRELHGARPFGLLGDGHDRAHQLLGLLEVLLARVALPRLLPVDGEEDQLAAVLLQALGIQLQGLNGLVAPEKT